MYVDISVSGRKWRNWAVKRYFVMISPYRAEIKCLLPDLLPPQITCDCLSQPSLQIPPPSRGLSGTLWALLTLFCFSSNTKRCLGLSIYEGRRCCFWPVALSTMRAGSWAGSLWTRLVQSVRSASRCGMLAPKYLYSLVAFVLFMVIPSQNPSVMLHNEQLSDV